MKSKKVDEFLAERKRMNEIVMKYAGMNIKKFYNLDTQAYQAGVLSEKTKEMLGLVASFVLRCDDCINYHLVKCQKNGLTTQELEEILTVGVMVGGTITIPHLRRAFSLWEELNKNEISS